MTPLLRQYLDDIVDTELIGSTAPNVALAFIREGVRRLIAERTIERRKQKRRSSG